MLHLAREQDASVVLIEDKGSGTHLIQDLQRSGELFPIACTPEGDKITRLHAQSVKFESGQVLLPERAPWRACETWWPGRRCPGSQLSRSFQR